MAILALETSTQMCGVALASSDGQGFEILYERDDLLQRAHSRMLLPMIKSAMLETGLCPGQIDAIAVTTGPGSFTGIRIGMATAKGLALAWHVPLIPVGTLDVMALNVAPEALVCPVLDARRGAVYSGLFRVESVIMHIVAPVTVLSPPALVSLLVQNGEDAEQLVLLGDAVEPIIEAAKGMSLSSRLKVYNGDWYPRSANVARLAALAHRQGKLDGAKDVVPTYFRRSEAEEKRDAR